VSTIAIFSGGLHRRTLKDRSEEKLKIMIENAKLENWIPEGPIKSGIENGEAMYFQVVALVNAKPLDF
jgi:hypothetical protein